MVGGEKQVAKRATSDSERVSVCAGGAGERRVMRGDGDWRESGGG